jgi:hypothetical protein
VTTRVIQWATGSVGQIQLREIIADPDLELAGLFVYSPDKVGVDAGTIAGCPSTGVVATNDKDEILATEADVVLHAASKGFAVNTNSEDIVALLASGKTVITTTSYGHLPTFGRDVDEAVRRACAEAGSRFHAAGEHPGFMFERLATTMTGLCGRIDKITVQEIVHVGGIREPAMLFELMGMGKQPEDISIESPMFRAVSLQYEQSLAATAEGLGLRVDEIRHRVETATVDREVEVACGSLLPGSVVGQIMSWTAYHEGRPTLIAEEYWTCTDIPDWQIDTSRGMLVRVVLEGLPNISLELVIGPGAIPGNPGEGTGTTAVAMSALRAIPYVLSAPPGVVVPQIWGAYRWPKSTLLT